jgi:molecular chaperone DnaK
VDTVLLCGGSTRMPQVEDAVAEYFGQEPSKEINPDEAVARGAAVAAAIEYDPDAVEEMLPGESGSVTTTSVTPQPLGARGQNPQTREYYYDVLIEADEPLPAVGSNTVTTVDDYQSHIEFKIYEGPGPLDDPETNRIGEVTLDGIRQAPQGVPTIDIEFTVDEQGLLTLYAEDRDTGATVEATVEGTYRRGEGEIAEMKQGLPPNEG